MMESFKKRWNQLLVTLRQPRGLAPHVAQPMILPTYDGSGQATHPDVLRFATPWRGYAYWMVLTPFPFLQEAFENPSILASTDGQQWQVPDGVVNPLDATPPQGFHADPDMIYHPASDALWIYYLHTTRNTVQHLKRIRSHDGRSWSAPEILLTLPYQQIRSPALVCEPDGRLRLWAVNMSAGQQLELRESMDGCQWSAPVPLDYPQRGYRPSHIDVVAHGRGYAMIIQATPQHGGPNPLFFGSSPDGQHWRIHPRPLLGTRDAPNWASRTLYRSSFCFDEQGNLEVWYSGRGPMNENRIAYCAIPPAVLARLAP